MIKVFFKIVTFTQSTSPVLLSGNILIGFVVIYYLLLVLALVFKNYHFKRPAMFSALGIPLILLISFCPDYFDHYEVTFIDVGQGDSTLIRNGKSNILIDTGGSTKTDLGTNCLVPYLRKRKIRKLDAVLITHLDYDHYGALESLKNHFQVDQVIYGNDFADFENHSYVLGNLKIKNLNLYNISTDTNDQSGVFSFSIKDTSFLIEGDAPINIEKKILKDNPDIKVDYLKLGHHGSKTSSCFEYLKALEPKIAIISCGLNNQYGHPDKEVIARLEKLNIEYHRTDYEKTITYCVKTQ
ncbi:MAG: MBL fold metallo-hydrolase [Bacilli bacterium]